MNKVVLITGASSGIGKSIAEFLHYKGFIVYGTSRNPDKIINSVFPLIELDVRNTESIHNAVKKIIELSGAIDILINNAGVGITGPIEGWGMTNDGKVIYQSDGTEKIWTMNPANQKMIDYVNVYSGSSKIKSVNELEYIDGKIYCNIWQKDAIAIINPLNGKVEGIINLAGLRKFIKYSEAEVLNGIAYNPKTKTIFVTGKKWEKLFEISVTE